MSSQRDCPVCRLRVLQPGETLWLDIHLGEQRLHAGSCVFAARPERSTRSGKDRRKGTDAH